MEASRVIHRPTPCPSVAGFGRQRRTSARSIPCRGGFGFSDEGHVSYYASPRCGKSAAAMASPKKKGKLIKGLSKELKQLRGMDGLRVEGPDGKNLLEAAEALLLQLEKLREEEKEMKKKKKEEKSAMKAAQNSDCAKDASSSSSSSESSSDSECEKVIDMSCQRSTATATATATETSMEVTECNAGSVGALKEKIEVCMGGKCKKSGAGELMEEFRRRVGDEDAVVGCKCMGKCREGPNVRVRDESAVKPLCVGVGLDDVGAILENFFGEKKDLGLMAA
ncbi:hypothetical protein QJS04_geneDACA004689 [Acorus gramineus]|uniref:Uncharacterized protein n=1 Tax=Acorus gramineus TaxID=55184 RepID=A0AAV9BSH6_ACOGR|nr:hypothetical protein QJS04_geneDACA004689 [Acorus gramineus]